VANKKDDAESYAAPKAWMDEQMKSNKELTDFAWNTWRHVSKKTPATKARAKGKAKAAAAPADA